MIKKAYEKPIMEMVKIQQAQFICMSIQTTGLDEDHLNYSGGSGNASDAMVKGGSYNVWDDDWSK